MCFAPLANSAESRSYDVEADLFGDDVSDTQAGGHHVDIAANFIAFPNAPSVDIGDCGCHSVDTALTVYYIGG